MEQNKKFIKITFDGFVLIWNRKPYEEVKNLGWWLVANNCQIHILKDYLDYLSKWNPVYLRPYYGHIKFVGNQPT